LELGASGPKEMTDNCFELCLQLTQIPLPPVHHHHSCPAPARGPPSAGRPYVHNTYTHHSHTHTGPHTHEYVHTHKHMHSIRFACSRMPSCMHVLLAFYQPKCDCEYIRYVRTLWLCRNLRTYVAIVACDKPSWGVQCYVSSSCWLACNCCPPFLPHLIWARSWAVGLDCSSSMGA